MHTTQTRTTFERRNKILEEYYDRVLERKQAGDKAFKDIVGEEFELERKKRWHSLGCTAAAENIAGFNADLVVRSSKNNKIVAIEECKGHYVDVCFFSRFINNAAQIIEHYLNCGTNISEIPVIILCSATTYKRYDHSFESHITRYREDIQDLLRKKVTYLRYCDHDRVPRKDYFQSDDCCFKVSPVLIQEQRTLMTAVGQR